MKLETTDFVFPLPFWHLSWFFMGRFQFLFVLVYVQAFWLQPFERFVWLNIHTVSFLTPFWNLINEITVLCAMNRNTEKLRIMYTTQLLSFFCPTFLFPTSLFYSATIFPKLLSELNLYIILNLCLLNSGVCLKSFCNLKIQGNFHVFCEMCIYRNLYSDFYSSLFLFKSSGCRNQDL